MGSDGCRMLTGLLVGSTAVLLVTALVPEISLPTASHSSNNRSTFGPLVWLNLTTQVAPRTEALITTLRPIIDDNFDVIDPNPTALNTNQIPITAGTKSRQPSKKPRRNKWSVDHKHKNHHHHDSTLNSKRPKYLWTKNDILESSTPTSAATPQPAGSTCDLLSTACSLPYRLLDQRKGYDVRWYPTHKWASAIVMSEDERLLAVWEGLAKLEEYFDGYNEPGAVMNLTYPLLTQLKHGKHPGIVNQELRDVTLSVPVPARHQINPPLPVSAEVLLDVVDSSTIFVQSFRARLWELTDRALRHRADKFMTTLRNHGEAFHDRYYYLAAFTKPDNTELNSYEMWIHATRLRDPGRVKPAIASRDPPLNKVTSRTRKRLCRGVECPAFDVLRVYKFGIQKRRYFDTVLVQASTTECEFNSLSVWRGFMPLHLYKHGINSHFEVLEVTRPIGIVHVRDRIMANETMTSAASSLFGWLNNQSSSYPTHCKHNMTVSLYLPQRLHSNPPTAGIGAPPVKINRVDDLIVYVQTVGGSILDPVRSTIEVRKFGARLRALGLCYKEREHYLVIYDFMVRFHGRQNEIWMLADRCGGNATGT